MPSAGMIIAGDANSLDWKVITDQDKSLHQIVTEPTRGDKILDVVIRHISRIFGKPIIVNAIPVDAGKKGVPSDHKGVILKPSGERKTVAATKKTIQPMPKSLVDKFGRIIT